MPAWIVELFGSKELNQLFMFLSLMTAPFWLMMLFFPRRAWVSRICHPFLVPGLLVIVWGYILFLMLQITGMPELDGTHYKDAKGFIKHPFVFLAFWCHIQILNFFLGTVIYQKANRAKINASFAILLTWLFGLPGLLVFAIHLLARGKWGAK